MSSGVACVRCLLGEGSSSAAADAGGQMRASWAAVGGHHRPDARKPEGSRRQPPRSCQDLTDRLPGSRRAARSSCPSQKRAGRGRGSRRSGTRLPGRTAGREVGQAGRVRAGKRWGTSLCSRLCTEEQVVVTASSRTAGLGRDGSCPDVLLPANMKTPKTAAGANGLAGSSSRSGSAQLAGMLQHVEHAANKHNTISTHAAAAAGGVFQHVFCELLGGVTLRTPTGAVLACLLACSPDLTIVVGCEAERQERGEQA